MKKSYYVPVTVVAADPEIERMRGALTSNGPVYMDADGTLTEDPDTYNEGEVFQKPKVVPKGVVATSVTETVQDYINELSGNNSNRCEESEEQEYAEEENRAKPTIVPKGIVAAGFWYEENPELLRAEVESMYKFQGDRAKFHILRDGRACWTVRCQPRIAGRPKKHNRTYDIALIYDENHPRVAYGSSVRAYLLKPTLEDLKRIVDRTPSVSPKNIPHTLMDDKGELYLCSADTSNVSDDPDSEKGITSASTSLRFALRWINVFELGLIDPVTWKKFHSHGEI